MPALEDLAASFPEIPPSVMLKIDLLRRGVRMPDWDRHPVAHLHH